MSVYITWRYANMLHKAWGKSYEIIELKPYFSILMVKTVLKYISLLLQGVNMRSGTKTRFDYKYLKLKLIKYTCTISYSSASVCLWMEHLSLEIKL